MRQNDDVISAYLGTSH
ncbi:hypothetical protein ACVBEH_02565 [Roseateles sp. GG27B]